MSQQTPEAPNPTRGPGAPPPHNAIQQIQAATASQPDQVKRFLAYLIDAVILAVVSWIPFVGPLAAIGGWLFRDIALEGRLSPGKKVIGLQAVTKSGGPITLNESIRRNAIFAVGPLAAFIGSFGWLAGVLSLPLILLAGALVLVEGILVLTGSERIGDRLAATKVVPATVPVVHVG